MCSIFTTILRDRHFYYLHFTAEETDTERIYNLFKAAQYERAEPGFKLSSLEVILTTRLTWFFMIRNYL